MDGQLIAQVGERVLVAPLNWGLGHATRCVPIVQRLLAADKQVTLAGDGESLSLLRKHFPDLAVLHLPSLQLRYSAGKSQVGAMLRALPKLLWWMWMDHRALREILAYQHFDTVISDNRFALWGTKDKGQRTKDGGRRTEHIYITHQLMIKMPRGWKWAEGMVHWLHGRVIRRYDVCWVPDVAGEKNLSGDLAHRYPLPKNAQWIGLLSRFGGRIKDKGQRTKDKSQEPHLTPPIGEMTGGWICGRIVAVLSGLEPQRSMMEKELLEKYAGQEMLLVRGKVNEPFCQIQRGRVTIVPYLDDDALAQALLQAQKIIARSGYSTIMDLAVLGVIEKAELIPTPGQTEQEYLAEYLNNSKSCCNFAEE